MISPLTKVLSEFTVIVDDYGTYARVPDEEVNRKVNEIKKLILNLIGEDVQGVQIVAPEDYTSDEYEQKGYNEALKYMRQKVQEL